MALGKIEWYLSHTRTQLKFKFFQTLSFYQEENITIDNVSDTSVTIYHHAQISPAKIIFIIILISINIETSEANYKLGLEGWTKTSCIA